MSGCTATALGIAMPMPPSSFWQEAPAPLASRDLVRGSGHAQERADHLKAHLRIDFYHAGLCVIRVQQVEGRGGFERQRLGNPACKSYSCAGWKTALRFKLIGPSSKRSEWLFHKGVASHC